MVMYNPFKKKEKEKECKECMERNEKEKENIQIEEIDKKPKEKWIWVEGYKGTNEKLQGYGQFQFELGKNYVASGDIMACDNGFHFALKLKDVFNHYHLRENNRFFKVKALVKEEDYNKYGTEQKTPNWWGSSSYIIIDKLVAKEIVLLEELSNEFLYDECVEGIKNNRLRGMFDLTLEEFTEIRKCGIVKVGERKIKEGFSRMEISGLLTEILIKKLTFENKMNLYKFAKGLEDSGVSTDMFIYLLINEVDKMVEAQSSI